MRASLDTVRTMASQKSESNEEGPKTGWGSRSRVNIRRHFLAVGCPSAGKTTMLAIGLRRLQCLGAYPRVEYPDKYPESELESTRRYPNYRCTVPWKLAKGRVASKNLISLGFGSLPQDWWHDCDGMLFAGRDGAVEMAKPLLKAARRAHIVFYISPANVVLGSDGQLRQEWLAEVRDFGKCVRRSKWWSDILNRRRRLCLIISQAEELRSPDLSVEALGKLLDQIDKKKDLAEHYDAAFLIRATTNRLRDEAKRRKGWEPCVEEHTEAGDFLKELEGIGFAGGDFQITDDQTEARFRAFESAVPLAWAAGFVKDKALAAYPQCFRKFC